MISPTVIFLLDKSNSAPEKTVIVALYGTVPDGVVRDVFKSKSSVRLERLG